MKFSHGNALEMLLESAVQRFVTVPQNPEDGILSRRFHSKFMVSEKASFVGETHFQFHLSSIKLIEENISSLKGPAISPCLARFQLAANRRGWSRKDVETVVGAMPIFGHSSWSSLPFCESTDAKPGRRGNSSARAPQN
jgi:hypothetical protein